MAFYVNGLKDEVWQTRFYKNDMLFRGRKTERLTGKLLKRYHNGFIAPMGSIKILNLYVPSNAACLPNLADACGQHTRGQENH